jgi:nucleotide-binding universal stress UspA family protein
MKVLLAVDGSTCSERASQMLIAQLARADNEVRVVHVDEWPRDLPPASTFTRGPHAGADIMASHERRRNEAEAMVARVTTQLKEAGFSATGDVIEGEARQAILDAAVAWPADLIIMGSHGRTGLNRLLLGSVSDGVSRHATCSVQIVRDSTAKE